MYKESMNLPSGPQAPSESYSEALTRAAELFRIQSSFHDIWGKQHTPTDDAKQAILRSLGVPTDSTEQLNQAIADTQAQQALL